LGTLDDFDRFVERARSLGLEVALDFAIQCSPDHPWVTEHPEWFFHRPDGTIKYAENPPKKYQDVYPLNFLCPDPVPLWQEVRRARVQAAARARGDLVLALRHLLGIRALREPARGARIGGVSRLGEVRAQAARLEGSRQPRGLRVPRQSDPPREPRPPPLHESALLPRRQPAGPLLRQDDPGAGQRRLRRSEPGPVRAAGVYGRRPDRRARHRPTPALPDARAPERPRVRVAGPPRLW